MTTTSFSLSTGRRRILAEMGIEVWVRRGTVKTSAAPVNEPESEPTALADAASVVVQRTPTLRAADPATAMRIALDCVAAPGVVVIGRFANPHDRRLAHDIALAFGGTASDLKLAEFVWPQIRTGDSSPAAARNAYRGFLRGQIERAAAHWLLLLGNDAQALLGEEADIDTQHLLRLPDAAALRADPMAKKRLWLSVSTHVPS